MWDDPPVIAGAHTIIYSQDVARTRAFLRDVLGFDAVDAGGGWLIFALPPSEVAVHPVTEAADAGRHELYLMCHDIETTVEELRRRGVELTAPISDERWGRITRAHVPGAGDIGLYEPRHPSPLAGFGDT